MNSHAFVRPLITSQNLKETVMDPTTRTGTSESRADALDRIMRRPLWEEADLSIILDVQTDAVRHMKSRGEIPGVVQLNLRKWFVHRDAFLEHIKQQGMPKSAPGRPRGSKTPPAL